LIKQGYAEGMFTNRSYEKVYYNIVLDIMQVWATEWYAAILQSIGVMTKPYKHFGSAR